MKLFSRLGIGFFLIAGTGCVSVDNKEQSPQPALNSQVKSPGLNFGVTALNSGWANYGIYVLHLMQAVQNKWDKIVDENPAYVMSGTVSVTFVLNSKGEISKILKVESSDGTADVASKPV